MEKRRASEEKLSIHNTEVLVGGAEIQETDHLGESRTLINEHLIAVGDLDVEDENALNERRKTDDEEEEVKSARKPVTVNPAGTMRTSSLDH